MLGGGGQPTYGKFHMFRRFFKWKLPLEKTAKLTGKGGSDEKEDLKETTFENPTVEDIKQLQEEPKKLKDKKSEWINISRKCSQKCHYCMFF